MHSVDKTAPPRRTRLTAEQRRKSILNAATEVFAAAGYRAAKVSDVAARIGVSEPVIFQNFGSKEALYAAVLDRAAHEIQAELHALAGQHGSAADLLAHVLSPRRGSGPHGPGAHGPGAHGSGAHGSGAHGPEALFADAATLLADPGLTEPARSAARGLAGHLADLVRRGQADGSIRAGADPEAAAWMLLSVLSARHWRVAVMPGPARLEDDVTDLALRALIPPREPRSG
jgi:AcrR family transcriptional regulator